MRWMGLVAVAATVVACSGGPAPTPQIVYVTPGPATTSDPPATATPRPTVAARPTFTEDDEKIDDLIRDGMAEMIAYTERLGDPNEDTVTVMREGRDFAENQLLLVDVYQPSECTEQALGFWRQAMEAWQFTTQKFLDWVAEGMGGDPESQAEEAGQFAGQARNSLDASC